MTVTEYDAANAQVKLKGLEAISQTLTAVTTAKGKVNTKVDDTNSEIQKLQAKAADVDSGNQGKMKKLQRKSKILMDKIKDLGNLQGQLDTVIDMLQRRKLDYLSVYKIGNRARVIDGELYLRDEADALIMNVINMRRHSEAFDLERTNMLLKALPKEFRD
jgi:predicted RNase H-like nuclease (RuvC/YqgF family)